MAFSPETYALLKAQGGGGSDLPSVTAADNGKVLGVVNGAWAARNISGLCTIIEFELNKSFNDLLAMINAGVIPYFVFNDDGPMMMIAQFQSYEFQENVSYTAYFGSYDGWQAAFISSDPDDPMVMD